MKSRKSVKLYAQRIRINRQGYDSSGSYWGIGAPLYLVTDVNGSNEHYVRANSAVDAKRSVAFQFALTDWQE